MEKSSLISKTKLKTQIEGGGHISLISAFTQYYMINSLLIFQ